LICMSLLALGVMMQTTAAWFVQLDTK
jgi:hypothetical protein